MAKPKKRKWLLIPAVILIALVAAGAIRYNEIQNNREKEPDQAFTAPPQPKNMVAWGEVTYEKVYDIIIDFPSFVTEVMVKEGDHVVLDQQLVLLDMSEYLGTIDKLQEQLNASKAALVNTSQDTAALSADIAQLQKDIETKSQEYNQETNSDLKILKTSLELAKTDVENAKRDVQEYQALHDAGSSPQNVLEQYIDILAKKEKALSDVENNIEKTKSALRAELDQLNIALQSKQSQLDQILKSNTANTAMQSSSVNVSRIDLKLMKSKSTKDFLKDSYIVSHVKNAIVQNIGVINGSTVGAQNMPTRVLQLIDADSIVVSAEVEEEFIKNVMPGMPVSIVPTSDSSLSIPGTVIHISSLAVEKDGKRIVRVQVKPQDPQENLKPGYTADVYFPLE